MPALDQPEFLQIFKTRREYCRALLELSRRQMSYIQENDYSGLIDLLGHKQRLLGRLDQLSEQQPDLWTRWKDRKDQLAAQTRQLCDEVLAESESILAELLQHEHVGTDELTKRRDDTRRQLETVTAGSQVNDAYRESLAPATHRRLDVGR